MFEEQFEAGEVNHAEEVFDVVFVASESKGDTCEPRYFYGGYRRCKAITLRLEVRFSVF